MLTLSAIINLARYPIVDLTSPEAHAVIASCQAQLAQDGLCLLPEFICAETLSKTLTEAQQLVPKAHHTEHWRSTPNGATAEQTSSLARDTRASIGAIAYDYIAVDSPLRQLYEWDGFTAFINAVLNPNGPLFYRTEDPIVSCSLTVLGDNDELGWHYDPNDGVVSLLLQQADSGGEFEFTPAIRAPAAHSDENELAVLDGKYAALISHQLKPGTLSLFNGHRSLHRVAPVQGQRQRIIALFNYAAEPGYSFSKAIQKNFFGRIA